MPTRKTTLRFSLIAAVMLLCSLLGISAGRAGMPTGRTFPPGSAHQPYSARGRITVNQADELRDIQQVAELRPAGHPKITTQPGQKAVTVEQRADVQTLLSGIRTRSGTGRAGKMQVMSQRRAQEFADVGDLPVRLEPGQVALEHDVVQVVMNDKTVVRMKFEIEGDVVPSVAEVEHALQQLPGKIARDPRVPDTLVYQGGEFLVGQEGSNLFFMLQPITTREQAGSTYAQR